MLSQLIQSYLVNTVDPVADSRPYLSAERYIANVTDDKRRKHVEETFKHLTSNRPRHLPEEEIYDWERIYKVIYFIVQKFEFCWQELLFFVFVYIDQPPYTSYGRETTILRNAARCSRSATFI